MNKEFIESPMRRELLKAIVGFPITVVAGCVEPQVAPTGTIPKTLVIKETKDVQWRQYQSPIMPYSVDYPQLWSISSGQFDRQNPFESFQGTVDGATGIIIVSTNFFAGTLEQLKNTFVENARKMGAKTKIVAYPNDEDPLSIDTIDGVNAYTVEVYIPATTLPNQPIDLITYQTFFLKDGRNWSISASIAAAKIEEIKPYYRDFARSFRMRKKIY